MKRLLTRSAVALSLVLAACSGGSDDNGTTPPPTPTIGVTLSSAAGTVARGASGTSTVTLTRGGSYTGEVTLAASGAPTGVTVAFAPATLSGATTSSVATISVANTAAPGSGSITITASGSGVTSATSTYNLTIPTPAIALAAGSTTLSVVQGATGTVPVTITRSNGFADAVTLAVSGLPTGVTGTFNPATVAAGSTTSTLSLAVAANAAAATTPITITASGTGITAQTATVNLTVTAAATPAISLTANPAAVNVTAGQTATSAIGIARTGGFTGDVTLALEGAPTGLTGAFSANPVGSAATTSTLTLSTTSAVTPGTYNLTVRGTGTGVTAQTATVAVTIAAAPGVTLSAITAQSLSQGTSSPAAIPIILTRIGGLAGDLTMSLEGAPTGVTATFAPNPATGASAQMTLNASATAAPGNYNLTVRATGAGNVSGVATFALTVTASAQGSFSLAAVPTTVSGQQGATVQSTINIARAGGFTGAINLTVTGVPTGATATFTPASATGAQSTLGIAIGAATPVGNHTLTVRGQGAGVTDVTLTITLTVTASGGGGGGNVNWTFCDPSSFPLWFAVQSGSGAWTRVTSTGTINRVYSFNANGNGGVAIARQYEGSTGVQVTVMYLNAAEMASTSQTECQNNRATKTLNGTATNVAAGQTAFVAIGGGTGTVTGPGTAYTITDAADGATDLVGVRTAFNLLNLSFAPDRGVIRRNVNYAAGSTVPAVDFQGSESFPVASADYTVTNASGETIVVIGSFLTANGMAGTFSFPNLAGGNVQKVYGVPSANTVNGDLHQVLISASSGTGTVTSSRTYAQFNRNLENRSITLGPVLTQPNVTSLGSAPYARWQATGSWQTEYGDGVGVSYYQQTSNSNSWTISVSRNYAGNGGTYTLAMPDFSGVAGFSTAWTIPSGSTSWSLSASGGITNLGGGAFGFGENGSFRAASRTGVTN
ncbi:MAG: hypothetical protein IBJ03_16475 [Gemmatimonadaceae bacterium]|nr:hypothetical protein [Gemmatimonadaceae bacterium]